jgi:redox-sensitive bicupin YhaK (pirin superfamily)
MQDTRVQRPIKKIWKSQRTTEGAGVHLSRAFGFHQVPQLDPFLLLDDFRSENPEDYKAGFPWHPHRGIETITYVLDGDVEHKDSLGNSGVISSGDIQWMTAGSGIIHQEMPEGNRKGQMFGFQLWANLPAKSKMMNPRYRDVKQKDVPVLKTKDGAEVRIIAGEVEGKQGPVKEVVIEPEYLDVSIPAGKTFTHLVQEGHTVFAFVIEGEGDFYSRQNFEKMDNAEQKNKKDSPDASPLYGNGTLILYGDGNTVIASADRKSVRFLLVSGKPIREPIAWYGPIVMNTQEELHRAFQEYHDGTFTRQTP